MFRNWKTTVLGSIAGIGQIITGLLTQNYVLVGTGIVSIIQGVVTKDYDQK